MTTLATQITATTTPSIVVNKATQYQEITLHSTATVYLGGSDVTSSNGFKMDNGDKFNFTIAPNTDLYCVANSGTPTIFVIATVL